MDAMFFFLKKGGTTNTCNISFDQTIIMQTNARALTEINVNIGRIFLVITQSKKPQEVTNPRKKIVTQKFKYTVSFIHCHKNLPWYLTQYHSPIVTRVYHDHESRWQSAPASFPALFQKHNISFSPLIRIPTHRACLVLFFSAAYFPSAVLCSCNLDERKT